MAKTLRDFQIFVKPVGSICNFDCDYCYYKNKESLFPGDHPLRMPDDILEKYIFQHIEASRGEVINFSWHGGEPTLLGIDYFKKIVEFQEKHKPPFCKLTNGIQTNGVLLDDSFCAFLSKENFSIGISIDGPANFHDKYRIDKKHHPTHSGVMKGLALLQKYKILYDVLCVVHDQNVQYPLEVYRFFRETGVRNLTFLPLVELQSDGQKVSARSVPAEAFGEFLCTIFDEWQSNDIGLINVQIFEETIGTALGREQRLCIFRETCGDIPVVEYNGDFYSCDHFVDKNHRIGNICNNSLADMLESFPQRNFGNAKQQTLPDFCKACNVLVMCNGGCPKDRFAGTPDGKNGLNYLCAGYKRFFNHCRPFLQQLSILSS